MKELGHGSKMREPLIMREPLGDDGMAAASRDIVRYTGRGSACGRCGMALALSGIAS